MEPGDIDTRPPYDGESLQGYVADIAGTQPTRPGGLGRG